MDPVKTVGKSGQIFLGKALAGLAFIVEQLPDGNILLKRVDAVPANERWLHEPAMRQLLREADAWMRRNPPAETNLDEIENKLANL